MATTSQVLGITAQATIGEVFQTTYERVDGFIETLDEFRKADLDFTQNQNHIPETTLQLNWGKSSLDWLGETAMSGWARTTHVVQEIDLRHVYLLSRTADHIDDSDNSETPRRVSSSRGRELGSDFSIGYIRGTDLVQVRLETLGYKWTKVRPDPDEPTGKATYRQDMKIRNIQTQEVNRINAVVQRINDTVTAAERIFDGNDPRATLLGAGFILDTTL